MSRYGPSGTISKAGLQEQNCRTSTGMHFWAVLSSICSGSAVCGSARSRICAWKTWLSLPAGSISATAKAARTHHSNPFIIMRALRQVLFEAFDQLGRYPHQVRGYAERLWQLGISNYFGGGAFGR